MRLYHFTCEDHGASGIREDGLIKPAAITLPGGRLTGLYVVWLTDLPDPRRDQVGLTSSVLLTCDRMSVRFEVEADAERWRRFARRHRDVLPGWWRRDLERFGDPWHWFVSEEPVPAAKQLLEREGGR